VSIKCEYCFFFMAQAEDLVPLEADPVSITNHKLSHPHFNFIAYITSHSISGNQQNILCMFLVMSCVTWQNKSIKASCRRARKLHSEMRCQCTKHAPHDDTDPDDAPPSCPCPCPCPSDCPYSWQIATEAAAPTSTPNANCGKTLKANYLTCDIMREFLPWGP